MGTAKKVVKQPDALELLKEQHDQVDALIERLEALGAEMLALFQSLMTQEPRKTVPSQTRKPASL